MTYGHTSNYAHFNFKFDVFFYSTSLLGLKLSHLLRFYEITQYIKALKVSNFNPNIENGQIKERVATSVRTYTNSHKNESIIAYYMVTV